MGRSGSLVAVTIGSIIVIPAWLSYYNCGQRIRRAQASVGVPEHERISPTLAFLLLVPGGLLVIPTLIHYWYVTKHQNMALRGAAEREQLRTSQAPRGPRGLAALTTGAGLLAGATSTDGRVDPAQQRR